ncbi:MAG: FHA domain-containing protein [Polyangiaceae bacterium]
MSHVGRPATSPARFTSPFALRLLERTIPLATGTTIIGRSRRCDIVIGERKVSRLHARLVVHAHEVILEDISHMNRVWVNDCPLESSQRIEIGDRLAFGPVRAELCAANDRSLSIEPTERAFVRQERAASPVVFRGLQPPRPAAIRAPAPELGDEGKQDGARTLLERFVLRCEVGPDVSAQELEMSVAIAMRFAESTRDGAWVNYVFRVFTALRRTLPSAIVERLYTLLRRVSNTSLTTFRTYTAVLEARRTRLGPSEQHLVRRIQGLEPLIVLQAHTTGT